MLLARHVMLFAFLCAFESFTAFQIRNDVSNSRDGVDVNNSSDGYDSNKLRELANAVISALRSLKEEKSGAEVKAAFQYIVQLAGVLLKGTQLGVHDVPETTTVINATVETGVNAAVKLNVELALLRQYARRLLKAVDERNEKDILISVITIQQRASLVIGIIDEAAIESISYQDPADEDQVAVKRAKKGCRGIYLKTWVFTGCIGESG
ncbi:hypothetical protein BsWGS_23705 [Bradybaena similaris]